MKNLKCYFIPLLCYLLFIGVLLLLVSCKTIKYIPVETIKTEYVSKTDTFIQKDSIYYRDSIYIDRNGDTITVYKTQLIYKDRWKEKIKTDTIFKTDSIQVPYPVEKPLSVWQKFKMSYGGFSMCVSAFLFLVILILIVFLKNKFGHKL